MLFHWPFVLLALPLVLAALLALFVRSYHARQRLLGQFASLRLLPALLTSYSPGLRRVKHSLIVSGALLVIFALARPQWGYDWQEQRARGVDVMFVVDTSKSMLSQDVLPSRLERAKLAIIDLVEKMQGNRVGLVAFAGQAFLQCPLTLDYDAFRQSLEAVDVTTITQGGTNIAAGLNEAAAALENSGNHKVIVLLTDGEDLDGDGIATAKTLRDQGVTIYTVGVGTPQGDIIPIAGKDGQVDFVRDDHGQIVKSHLDAATLTAIAQASNNGFYEPLGATGEGLVQVYEAGIKTMPEQQTTSRLQQLPLERFQWPLALALFFLALDPLIGTRRPSWARRAAIRENASVVASISTPAPKSSGKTASSVIALLLAVALWTISVRPAHAQAAATPPAPDTAASTPPAPSTDDPAPSATAAPMPDNAVPSLPDSSPPSAPANTPIPASPTAPPAPPASAKLAEQLYRQGDYKAAAAAYGEAANAHPQDGRFRYDQGASLYRSGDFDAASQAFQQTLSANNLGLQQQAYYGLGNSRYRLGQAELKQDPKKTVSTWESAAKDYQNALELNPNDPDAHYNLDLLKTQLAELKKQLEQQQKQQQQQQNQQNQNQQDQQNQQNQQSQQNQSSSPQNSSQNQQSQQQKDSSQQSQQSQQNQQQSGQQNQQQQSGQQGQQNQSQQNQSQQNHGQPSQSPSGNPQSPQNQNQSGQNQSSQKSPDQNSPNQPQPGQQKSGQQPQPGQQGSQPKPQPQPGQNGQQPRPQPGQNPQQGQQPSPQPPNSGQPPGNSTAGQPAGAQPGQKPAQPGTAAAAGGAASGAQSGENGNVTVAVPGAMTREEARQVLDSLKNSERKLPVTNYDSQKEGAQDASSPGFKDW